MTDGLNFSVRYKDFWKILFVKIKSGILWEISVFVFYYRK